VALVALHRGSERTACECESGKSVLFERTVVETTQDAHALAGTNGASATTVLRVTRRVAM
jgi:c-di-GMP-binding flagellar brake protein YcgR